ncbi:MAG: hypothetical protein PHD56_07630 [Anaerostipes sp.]|nr:hypothetical protein [Anaerostipes sp.]
MEKVSIVKEEKQNIQIEFSLFSIGDDFLVVVEGGDVSHIGAVTLGNQKEEITSKLKGHKEHIITHDIFHILKEGVRGNILVSGGIHIDHISIEEIQLVQEMCQDGASKVNKILKEITND